MMSDKVDKRNKDKDIEKYRSDKGVFQSYLEMLVRRFNARTEMKIVESETQFLTRKEQYYGTRRRADIAEREYARTEQEQDLEDRELAAKEKRAPLEEQMELENLELELAQIRAQIEKLSKGEEEEMGVEESIALFIDLLDRFAYPDMRIERCQLWI